MATHVEQLLEGNGFPARGSRGSDSGSEDVERRLLRAPGRIERIDELAPVVLLAQVFGGPRPRLHRRAR
jgi:hypothetical protein